MARDLSEVVSSFDPDVPIERAHMPPSRWYTSDDFAALERERVWRRNWLPVARCAQVADVGSAISGCIAKEPWLVVRGERLRAFHNTCRHKGNLVVTKPLTEQTELRCGYHGWSYGLDGRLRSAPRIAGIEDFDRSQLSLPPLAVAQWGPWVFVHHDTDAAWPSKLAPLDAELEATGWRSLRYASSASWELECNWKVYIDNYLDGGYHIGEIHPSLDAVLDGTHYETSLHPGYSIQRAPASDAANRIGGGALYAFIYPNFMINRYGDCLEGNFVTPISANRCRVDYDFFFTADTSADVIEASVAESAVIQRQDIGVSEAVQVGLESSGFDRGRYAPRVEVAEHHFHCALARDLRR